MHSVLSTLFDALALGAVKLQYGRIHGRSGYLDVPSRTVVLNPDADPDELAAELNHDLAQLIEQDAELGVEATEADPAVGEPAGLELVHSTDEPEIPAPRRSHHLDGPTAPDLRVIG